MKKRVDPIVRCEHCSRYVCHCTPVTAQEGARDRPVSEPRDWAPWMSAFASNA